MPLLSVVTLPQVPGTVPSSTARAQRRAPHASPGRPLRRRCQERGAGGAGPGARAARHSPRRLKLSDKVLRNFFILPIFSGGCGSMRSHIWATPGRGNFPKLVQSGAQTTASARRGEGGASASTSASASASSSGREATRGARSGRPSVRRRRWGLAGLRGGRALRGAGGGLGPRRRSGSAPRRRPAHFPSFVTRGGAARQGAGAGRGRGAGAGGRRGRGRGEVLSPEFRALGRKSRGAEPLPAPPSAPLPRPRPAFPSATAPGRGTPARPRLPARSPRPARPSPPRGAPSWPPPLRPAPPPRPRAGGPGPGRAGSAQLGTLPRAWRRPRREGPSPDRSPAWSSPRHDRV